VEAQQGELPDVPVEESLTIFRTLFENSRDAVGVSRAGIHAYVNPTYLHLFGYTSFDEIRNRLITDQIAPSSREEVMRYALLRAEGKEAPLFYETRGMRVDGTEFDMEVKTSVYEVAGKRYTLGLLRDITEQKKAEQALHESQATMEAIINSTTDLIWSVDHRTFVLTSFNKSLQTHFNTKYGLQIEHGMCINDLFNNKAAVQIWIDLYQRALKEAPFTVEHVDATGTRILEISFNLLKRNGKVFGISGFGKDITERKQAEQAAAQQLAFERLLSDLKAKFLKLEYDDIDSAIIDAQRQFCQFLGADLSTLWLGTAAEPRILMLVQRCTLDEIPPVPKSYFADEHVPWITGQILDGQIVVIPDIHTLPPEAAIDRETLRIYGNISLLAIPFSLGEPPVFGALAFAATNKPDAWSKTMISNCQMIAHFFAEILARKDSWAKQRASEEKYRLLAENAQDWICLQNPESRYDYVSPSCERMTGYSPQEFLDHPDLYREIAHPEDRAMLDAHFADVKNQCASCELEYRIIHKTGTIVWINHSCSPIYHPTGQYLGRSSTNRNITAFKQAQQEATALALDRVALEAQLHQQQKLESIGRLAGVMAHDFNNMLAVIAGYVDILMLQTGPASYLYGDLAEIKNAADRSAQLIQQLLTFARKQTISPKVLNLNDSITAMMNMLSRLIGDEIELAWHPEENLGLVRMDPVQLDQILMNLCVNARDAITDHGIIVIETHNVIIDDVFCTQNTEAYPGAFVQLTVSDDGYGMTSHTMKHLFEPFFTTKAAGEGTGLGLATVYGVMKQNSGFITVYSELEYGTTFKLYFPCRDDVAVDGAEPQVQEALAAGHQTVLIVDDEPTVLSMGRRILELHGYRVLVSNTPNEAFTLAAEHDGEIDLLLTDVSMPLMNGRELAWRLLQRYPRMRCLYMSGYTENVITHHGELDPDIDFLQKPFSLDSLLTSIRAVLEQDEQDAHS